MSRLAAALALSGIGVLLWALIRYDDAIGDALDRVLTRGDDACEDDEPVVFGPVAAGLVQPYPPLTPDEIAAWHVIAASFHTDAAP